MAREWDVPGYTEVKVLGSGGFGEVVLARHDASGTRVAIKYLLGELLADREFAELFRAEAAVLASLDDPNVVRLYEYVESPSGAAIVMELIDGVSLRDILARQGKTTAEAALIVLQGSLLGLAAAHRRGVVHRDYKPENVLIDGAGASKLTDFGIAARAGDSPIPAGTLSYAPPEQFGGTPATPASDVYAATATFYECLTGRPPFTGDTAERLLYQHLSEPVPLEPVPEPLRPLIEAGLAKDPAGRPSDGAALVAELRAVAGGAYGPGWEDRGRSGLAAAALLLAALWPAGGPAAVQGTAVHWVRLRRRLPHWHGAAVKAAATAGVVTVAVVAAVVLLPRAHSSTRSSPPLAAPTSAAVLATPGLYGVSCTSPTACIAVGTSGNGTTVATSLAERWNGTNWTIQQTPGPPGATSSSFYSVSCTSPDACIAVGNFRRSGVTEPLAESWNGTKWALQQVSGPPGADGELYGISCSSATACTAVGNSDFGAALAERWNGSTWTIQRTPKPGGAIYRFTYLTSVSCTSPTACTAVGESDTGLAYSRTNIGYQTLAETWNGAEWTIQHTPSSGPGTDTFLEGVSCTSPTECIAAGDNGSPTATGGVVLAERWNGTNWAITPAPQPARGPFAFAGVSCTSPSSCTAVGGPFDVLAETWNGTNWAVTSALRPAGELYPSLSSVSCTSATACIAVGQSNNGAGSVAVPLAEVWDGTTWTILHTPTQRPPAAAPASSPVPSAVSSPALPPRQQAAQALAALLAQSGTDRAAITQAVYAVADCSAGLSQDEAIFSNAASSRQTLLGQIAALPDRSALPASMLQDLTAAWQASGEADQDFANWTQDEISRGCSTNDQSDASYQAAMLPDDQATKDKKAFAALWTAIADEYGLPLYRYNQI